jgi:quercetin dioxygenase-like cupin family protein
MRIVDLAELVGVSPSYISQVERALVHPSVGSLQKIACALGLHVADFFTEEDGHQAASAQREPSDTQPRVVRAGQRKGMIYAGSNVVYQLLSPDLRGNIEFLMIKGPPGSSSGDTNFQHEGEECGIVLQGRMTYRVGDTTVVLEPGDSIYFNSKLPHRWWNAGDEDLVAVWAVTPPSF